MKNLYCNLGIVAATILAIGTTPHALADAPVSLTKIGALDTGAGLNGAEITAYDPGTQRLFVTSGVGIDVIDFSDPTKPTLLTTIDPTPNMIPADSAVTSVTVSGGIIAAAVPGADEQMPGEVYFYSSTTLGLLNSVTVGALPDMVTFTPDGTAVLVANEGEPDDGINPTVDPEGSVSYIDISGGVGVATVFTIDFTEFNGQEAALRAEGVRIFAGRNAANDFEPEYIAVTPDGTTAFVTLQENNAVAKIDLIGLTVIDILPLGLKDYSLPGNLIDANDKDDAFVLGNQPVFGMYQPDAIATVRIGGKNYFLTANEGDDRGEDERIKNIDLDPVVFPNAAALQTDENIGRLGISTVDGQLEADMDMEFEKLFAYGGRSFSIRDENGNLVFDSGIATEVAANNAGIYPDGRSDNKGTEPEGVTTGVVGGRVFAFIGLERADAVAVFDISNPAAATFETIVSDIGVDDAPEGLVFIPGSENNTGGPLLVVSNEGDDDPATLAIYSIDIATQPDITFLSEGNSGVFIGDGVYDPSGLSQLFSDRVKGRKSQLVFTVQNDGNETDTFSVFGYNAPSRRYDVKFFQIGGGNVTSQLQSGSTLALPAFGQIGYQVRVRRKDKDDSSRLQRTISAFSTSNGLSDSMRHRVRFR